MKIELNLKDDTEFRAYIKEMIKGQVLSVAREEIRSIIAEVFISKYGHASTTDVELLIKDEVGKYVLKQLGPNGWNKNTWVRTHAGELIKKEVENILLNYKKE